MWWIACLLVASLSPDRFYSPSPVVRVEKDCDYCLLVTSTQKIERVYVDDLYENTDYITEKGPKDGQIRIRMLTSRRLIRFIVWTSVPGTKGLRRKYVVVVPDPSPSARRQ